MKEGRSETYCWQLLVAQSSFSRTIWDLESRLHRLLPTVLIAVRQQSFSCMFYPCFCYVSDDANLVIKILTSKCLAKFIPAVGYFPFLQLAVFHSCSWLFFIPVVGCFSFLQLAVFHSGIWLFFIPAFGCFSFRHLAVFFNAWDSYLLLPKRGDTVFVGKALKTNGHFLLNFSIV